MKRIFLLFIYVLSLYTLLSCRQAPQNHSTAAESNRSRTVETWTAADSSVCAWFDNGGTEDSMGINTEPLKLYTGKSDAGNEMFSFIRLPMKATWFGDEIDNARLYLNVIEGETPSALRIALINTPWSGSVTTLADARKAFDRGVLEQITVQQEQDGWISFDISKYVMGWLNGETPNYGLALLGTEGGNETVFTSDWNGETQNPPRLEVTGSVGNRQLTYGKFGYIRHPQDASGDAELEENETANCLSYALRDINMITAEDLALNYDEMTSVYRESGEDALADYCAAMVSDYVNRHKDALAVSAFRRIDSFDSEIDPAKEYRIALRVGCSLYDETEVLDEVSGNFDFHLWAQINNGQWAQKFLFVPTEILPCTPPGLSPAKYPWDAQPDWGYDKFDGFYTSKAVYFAVTKDADGFTEHKAES